MRQSVTAMPSKYEKKGLKLESTPQGKSIFFLMAEQGVNMNMNTQKAVLLSMIEPVSDISPSALKAYAQQIEESWSGVRPEDEEYAKIAHMLRNVADYLEATNVVTSRSRRGSPIPSMVFEKDDIDDVG